MQFSYLNQLGTSHVDVAGRLLVACVSPADVHDSRAAVSLLLASRWPWLSQTTWFSGLQATPFEARWT